MSVRAQGLDLAFSVVGPGRVGLSMARWLDALGARLTHVGSRRIDPARAVTDELGGEAVGLTALESSGDDLLLLTTSDPSLREVAAVLARRSQARVALHASGCVPVEALAALRSAGTEIGSLHPLRAFPEASTDVREAQDVVFAVGGDPGARLLADRIVAGWGGVAVEIQDEQRPLYHLAASLAAGGVVTLLATAQALAEDAKLPPDVVRGYLRLAHQALDQAERHDRIAAAVTGPVRRGDLSTIEEQLDTLGADAPEAVELVVALAKETLRQGVRSGAETPRREEILSMLAKALERKSFLDQN